jgi:hypothetical protein
MSSRWPSNRSGFDTLSDSERKGAIITGNQAAMIASRHVVIAADRRALCVCLVERWRWTLKVL